MVACEGFAVVDHNPQKNYVCPEKAEVSQSMTDEVAGAAASLSLRLGEKRPTSLVLHRKSFKNATSRLAIARASW